MATELTFPEAVPEVWLTTREEAVIHHAIDYIDCVTMGDRSICHKAADSLEDLRRSVMELKRARRRAREADKGGE